MQSETNISRKEKKHFSNHRSVHPKFMSNNQVPNGFSSIDDVKGQRRLTGLNIIKACSSCSFSILRSSVSSLSASSCDDLRIETGHSVDDGLTWFCAGCATCEVSTEVVEALHCECMTVLQIVAHHLQQSNSPCVIHVERRPQTGTGDKLGEHSQSGFLSFHLLGPHESCHYVDIPMLHLQVVWGLLCSPGSLPSIPWWIQDFTVLCVLRHAWSLKMLSTSSILGCNALARL